MCVCVCVCVCVSVCMCRFGQDGEENSNHGDKGLGKRVNYIAEKMIANWG